MRKLTVTLLGLLLAASAQAASHRTFVSTDGTDSGICGPTTPCRTLSYALTQTNDGGEIIITQSGGYGETPSGGVTIDKSISIIAEPGVFAALAPTTGYAGIMIYTAGINVAIKGLTINGRGGIAGIDMGAGASLDLDNVTITNFPLWYGVHVYTDARITIKNSTFRSVGYGVRVGHGANLLLEGTRFTDMGSEGITIIGGTSGTTVVTATNTLVRCSSGGGGYGFQNSANVVGKMYLDRVTVTDCAYGIINYPFIAAADNVIALSNSFVTGNGTGLRNESTNTLLSSGNNHVANNSTNTTGTITTGTLLH